MTSPIPASPLSAGADEAVAPLLEECARVLGWIARIDDFADEVPEHIAARVRSGYEQRLEQKLEELKAFGDAVRSQETAVREAAATAARARSDASDALHEAKLRHFAGELSHEDWAGREPGLAAELEQAEAECKALECALDHLGSMLDSLQRDGGEAAPAVEVAPPPAADEAEPEPSTAPLFELLDDAIVEEAVTPDDDQLDTIFAEWDDAPQAKQTGELPWLELLAEEDDAEPYTALTAGAATPATAAAPPAPSFGAAPAVVAAAAKPEEEDDGLAFLAELDRVLGTSPSGEGDAAVAVAPAAIELDVKTLTCAACQNDNPAQSWYCESCGAGLN